MVKNTMVVKKIQHGFKIFYIHILRLYDYIYKFLYILLNRWMILKDILRNIIISNL
jgi:hypothetical protein